MFDVAAVRAALEARLRSLESELHQARSPKKNPRACDQCIGPSARRRRCACSRSRPSCTGHAHSRPWAEAELCKRGAEERCMLGEPISWDSIGTAWQRGQLWKVLPSCW